MIFQAILPANYFFPIVITNVIAYTNVSVSELQMKYLFFFLSIPLYLPSVFNPIVAILMIDEYRRTFVKLFCRQNINRVNALGPKPSSSMNLVLNKIETCPLCISNQQLCRLNFKCFFGTFKEPSLNLHATKFLNYHFRTKWFGGKTCISKKHCIRKKIFSLI